MRASTLGKCITCSSQPEPVGYKFVNLAMQLMQSKSSSITEAVPPSLPAPSFHLPAVSSCHSSGARKSARSGNLQHHSRQSCDACGTATVRLAAVRSCSNSRILCLHSPPNPPSCTSTAMMRVPLGSVVALTLTCKQQRKQRVASGLHCTLGYALHCASCIAVAAKMQLHCWQQPGAQEPFTTHCGSVRGCGGASGCGGADRR